MFSVLLLIAGIAPGRIERLERGWSLEPWWVSVAQRGLTALPGWWREFRAPKAETKAKVTQLAPGSAPLNGVSQGESVS